MQHYFLLTVLLETSLKRNAKALISIPATLLRFLFVNCIFKLAAVWVFGIWQRRQRKFWGGIGVPVEGRLRSQQLSGWKYNSCLQLTSSGHAIVLLVFFKTKLILALAARRKKNHSTFHALYFFDIYIYVWMKRQMPVALV